MSADNTNKLQSRVCAFITGACVVGLIASIMLNWALYTGRLMLPTIDYLVTLEAQQDFKKGVK